MLWLRAAAPDDPIVWLQPSEWSSLPIDQDPHPSGQERVPGFGVTIAHEVSGQFHRTIAIRYFDWRLPDGDVREIVPLTIASQ